MFPDKLALQLVVSRLSYDLGEWPTWGQGGVQPPQDLLQLAAFLSSQNSFVSTEVQFGKFMRGKHAFHKMIVSLT